MTIKIQPNPIDLTTVADFAAVLSISPVTDAQSDLFQRLITAASMFLQTQLGRFFASQAYSENRNGTGTHMLMFANYPVTAVSAVSINGQAISAATPGDAGSAGYLFDETTLYLIGYRFWRGVQNISFSYTAGYATTPYDVEQYCIELAGRKMKQYAKGGERLGVSSTIIAAQNINYEKSDLTDTFKSLLRQYQKVIPV
jgi:hypothetical protein